MGDGGGGTTTEPHALVYFRVKQQNAMGEAPHVQVDYIYGRDITPDNIKAVVTQNDASATIVELYLQATESYSTFYYTQLGEGTVTLHNAQSWQSSLPSGTVISTQRIDYHMEDLYLTGDLGIGTTSPNYALDVRSGNINIQHAAPYIRMSDTDTSATYKHKYILGYDNYVGFDFYDGSTWKMTVKAYPDKLAVSYTHLTLPTKA